MDRDVRAYVGLGSNLDDPQTQVCQAIDALGGVEASVVSRISSLYRTAPVGYEEQPDFINAVCCLETRLAAIQLLKALRRLEDSTGRIRGSQRDGPRVLDLDLLLYGDACTSLPGLKIPHPRMHQRRFVLEPLYELDRDLVIPGWGPVRELLEGVREQRVGRISMPMPE